MRALTVLAAVLSVLICDDTTLWAQSADFAQPALFEGADEGTGWAEFSQPGYSTIASVNFQQAQPGPSQPGTAQPGAGTAQPNLGPQPAPGRLDPLANAQRPATRQQYLSRLSRAPDLFGDSFIPQSLRLNLNALSLVSNDTSFPANGELTADVPVGGGTRRFKNEQARALPTDRVFFYFNHFHNAVEVKRTTGVNRSATANVDQFTLGAEKTFDDGNWSAELRMPFAGSTDIGVQDFRYQSDGIGNLTATVKRLIYADDNSAIALGLAVSTPTGSDADADIPAVQVRIHTENTAVHLLPYLAWQFTPDENWFFHAFAQVDVAANGNEVTLRTPTVNARATVHEQTLLYLDASAGYWWYRSEDDDGLTGLASVFELHYTSTLNDAHPTTIGPAGFLSAGNARNRIDVVNLTCGLHTEWWNHTALRGALVVPLGGEPDRFFDSEIQVSLVRRF